MILFGLMDEAVMEESVENDITIAGAAGGAHIHDFSLKATNHNIADSRHLVTHNADNRNESSPHFLTDIFDGKNLDRIGSSEQASVSPRCTNDSGVMVEELTLKTFNGENLAIVGASNNRERLQSKQNWVHNYYTSGSVSGEAANRGKSRATPNTGEEVGDPLFPGLLDEKHDDEIKDDMLGNDDKKLSSNIFASGITRTKMVSKFGSSEYYIKNSLKGKGIIFKSPVNIGLGDWSGNKTSLKPTAAASLGSNVPLSSAIDNAMPVTSGVAKAWPSISSNPFHDGFILRDWLKAGRNKVGKMEKLRMFRQIVKLVGLSHSQGVVLLDLRPSCFKFLPSNQIMYLGSSVTIHHSTNLLNQDVQLSEFDQIEKRPSEQNLLPFDHCRAKKQKLSEGENFWRPDSRQMSSKNFMSHSRTGVPMPPVYSSGRYTLEEDWYSGPEILSGSPLTFSSNIYSLGVLLFELLCSFDSRRSHEAAMLDLRNRILPPDFLSENPKEAGFCLLLLHPDSSSRPSAREILQSSIMSGIQDLVEDELLPSIEERDAESELLLYFLSSLEEQKQKGASKLAKEIRFIEADIEEVKKRQTKLFPTLSSSAQDSLSKGSGFIHRGCTSSCLFSKSPFVVDEKLTRNIWQFENAYFSMRSRVQFPVNDSLIRGDTELLRVRENWYHGNDVLANERNDQLGEFYTDLCKYSRYSKFKVRGVLRNGDLSNSANVICSLSFDRDEEYLATGGVSKKIKIFEFQALFDDSVDIHYPVVEMLNKSKLSCVCWNSYIRNYLASTDYDGAVKLWDASTGQVFSEFVEHNERAWSVDFSHLDPKKFASGSDDRLVKLWSINEKNSLCTIRNNANVCCVQFSPESTNFLAVSSADYKTYCYDLRNISTPWCILAGHEKAVSYAKFLDTETLVSASTDNSLKIWDLKKTSSNSLSRDACVLTLQGHANEKNFVGLSITDGYITCGSETNEVFAYYRSLPMPITSVKFGSIDPISGRETDDDNGQFVSSVCWRRKSNMVIAANSTGCIKLLEMV